MRGCHGLPLLLVALLGAQIRAGAGLDTLTLRGRLLVIDLDYGAGEESGARDSHFALRASDRHVWQLRFPGGAEPPDAFGAGVEVEVQVLPNPRAVAAAAAQQQQLTAAEEEGSGAAGTGPSRRRMRRADAPASALQIPRSLSGVASMPRRQDELAQPHGRRMGPREPRAVGGLKQQQLQQLEVVQEQELGQREPQQQQGGAVVEGGARHRLQEEGQQALVVVGYTVLQVPQRPAGRPAGAAAGGARERAAGDGPQPLYNNDRLMMDDVSTVIFITDMCGYGAAVTAEDLAYILFDDERLSVSSYFSTCSHGRTAFSRDNVLILGPVPLDCSPSAPSQQADASPYQPPPSSPAGGPGADGGTGGADPDPAPSQLPSPEAPADEGAPSPAK
ncbi:hypothetical protein TSOC_009489 [Tetrabaena socialis]|uniref:Peptidase M11 gametolysin domain-containing protein n=1 Tax=Tetrabaena socialis TaxID=47790 RepID=A0A2J7ZVR7_9CHLO|nr:hypothetical protein TSOC_009489 [Tetrabaena socialis]|eukprot:PNH04349.1 hypothetical protein TSOC_009489 [Tetrabaena socialis]